jgi:type I restriction enzyme, S subunit
MSNSWKIMKLGELCETYAGGTPNRGNPNYYGGEIPWISSGEVNKPYIDDTIETITSNGLKFSSAKWIPKEAILIAMYGATAGQVSKLKIRASSNQAVLAVIPKELDDFFLYYKLIGLKNKILFLAQGSGQPNLSKSLIDATLIQYPPLPQQRKIAQILSTCDAVIEKTEAAIAKYQAIKQGMMHDLFTRGIDLNTGKLRPKYDDALEIYKESELGWIPKEWDVITIQDFASQGSYPIVDGPFGSNLKSIHYRNKGYPIIQSGFVTSNEFKAKQYLYVDKEKYFSEIRSAVKAGDIVMAKIGAQCGTCAILPYNHPDGIIAGNCLKISVDKNNNTEFLLHLLHQFRKIGKLDLITSTTAQPAISMSSLKVMEIPYPSLKEQNVISNSIKSLNDKIKSEQSTLSKYRQIKAGLMQDLLSGKVEVEVEENEKSIT